MTQEALAERCGVSRQSISKWEADIALPETEKLLLLGELFHISMDVLLKDELTLNEVRQVHSCGSNAIREVREQIYKGMLIKESVFDDTVIDLLNVHRVELWNTGGKPRYWTVLFFSSDRQDLPQQLSRAMRTNMEGGKSWFADFRQGNTKYIVFRDKILSYQIGDPKQKAFVCNECRKMGIADEEMNWKEMEPL